MVKRDNKVAVVVIRGHEEEFSITKNDETRVYAFRNHAGVCLAWVDEDCLGDVLDVRRVCCGGQRSPVFRLANQAHVDYWEKI